MCLLKVEQNVLFSQEAQALAPCSCFYPAIDMMGAQTPLRAESITICSLYKPPVNMKLV